MTKWQYWSPLVIGAVIGEIYGLQVFGKSGASPFMAIGVLPLLAALTGAVHLQLLLFAIQGLLAAVLPVPFGKSMRGAKCRVVGVLMLLGPVVALLFTLSDAFVYLGGERHSLTWFWWIWFMGWAAFAALSYPAALAIYLYSLPTAEPDFQTED